MINYSLDQLKNGLKVLRIYLPIESTTCLMLSNTGSRYESEAQFGIAHFLEHMVFKGSKKYPTALNLAEVIDGIGADFNAYTSKEYTGYYVKAASKHLDLALDVLSDMLLASNFKQEDIDREKGVIIEELNMYLDNPARHIGNLFEQMAYQGSGLSHDIIGLKKTIKSFKKQDFLDFTHQWYDLSNMTLVLAGKESALKGAAKLGQVESLFDEKYHARNSGKLAVQARQATFKANPLSTQKLHVEDKQTQQAHFVMAWPGIKRSDERKYAASLLSVILGGNMSSRLFSEIREKRGLAYYVHSDVDQYHDGGVFGVAAGVDLSRIEEALAVTVEQFYTLADGTNKIKAQELQKAKDYLMGSMILGFESSDNVAQFLGLRQLLLGKIESPEEIFDKIKAVSLEEVMTLAKQLFKENELRLAVIGQFSEKQKSYFDSLVNIK